MQRAVLAVFTSYTDRFQSLAQHVYWHRQFIRDPLAIGYAFSKQGFQAGLYGCFRRFMQDKGKEYGRRVRMNGAQVLYPRL